MDTGSAWGKGVIYLGFSGWVIKGRRAIRELFVFQGGDVRNVIMGIIKT